MTFLTAIVTTLVPGGQGTVWREVTHFSAIEAATVHRTAVLDGCSISTFHAWTATFSCQMPRFAAVEASSRVGTLFGWTTPTPSTAAAASRRSCSATAVGLHRFSAALSSHPSTRESGLRKSGNAYRGRATIRTAQPTR